jgi:hypothetical protein
MTALPSQRDSIVWTSPSRTGLAMWSSMPAARHRCRSSGTPAVIATIGVCRVGPSRRRDLGRGLEAVQNWQLAVHQHQPVAPSRHLLHGPLAVANDIGVIAEPGEDGDDHRLVDLVVLNQEDAGAALCRPSAGRLGPSR